MTEPMWPDPIERFRDSYSRAAVDAPQDHTAMTLVTATPDARPTGRIVLLKGFDHAGFVFFTNYTSRKGSELLANPHAGLCFYWPWTGEQIRVEGAVAKVSADESDAYFASRQRGSQVGCWASQQSQPLESREALIARCSEVENSFKGSSIPRPPHWGGFRLSPESFEFWQDGDFRLHDRFLYTRLPAAGEWQTTRLNP